MKHNCKSSVACKFLLRLDTKCLACEQSHLRVAREGRRDKVECGEGALSKWVCNCNHCKRVIPLVTKQREGVCPFTSIIKGRNAKARSLGIRPVFMLDINFDGFTSAKLYCFCFYEKDLQFSREIWLPKFRIYGFPKMHKVQDYSSSHLLSGPFFLWLEPVITS